MASNRRGSTAPEWLASAALEPPRSACPVGAHARARSSEEHPCGSAPTGAAKTAGSELGAAQEEAMCMHRRLARVSDAAQDAMPDADAMYESDSSHFGLSNRG
jgi:hypothetical protein